MKIRAAVAIIFVLIWAVPAFGAHPLITDDTGTQGKGKFQIEINGEYGHEKEDGATTNTTEAAAALSYGITDKVDIVLGVPYQNIRTKTEATETEDEIKTRENGISDISLEVKWNFFEKGGLSLALKPGISFPTGDDEKGLGTGRMSYSMFLIATEEIEPLAFHFNLGYIRNENKADEEKNIWHASVAAEFEAVKDLKLVANTGIEKNTDRNSNTDPAFILGGIIYSFSENFDIDLGVKYGINKPETDWTYLAGVSIRF